MEQIAFIRESYSCVMLGKSKAKDTFNQMETYYKDGFPQNFGLSGNSVIFRFHNDQKVVELMENAWNNLLIHNTKRDQLTLMYEIWKLDFKNYTLMKERVADSDFFKRKTHKYKFNRSLYKRFIGKLNKFKAKRDAKKYKIDLENLLNQSVKDKS